MRVIRRLLPLAGCGLPAAVLGDPAVADWVRAHGVTVYAGDSTEMDLAGWCRVPVAQVVLRCGGAAEPIREAVAAGVQRFVVSTGQQAGVLASCAPPGTLVHVDHGCPAVPDEGGLDVIGLHSDVGGYAPVDWGTAAGQLLGRIAQMRSGGPPLTRISLTGGPTAAWIDGDKSELGAIATAVDEAIDEGCARWRVPRPSVTFVPSGSAPEVRTSWTPTPR